MTNAFHENFDELEDIEEEKFEDFSYETENLPTVSDDNGQTVNMYRQIEHMLDSMTRIGGEVCKLRAEVDGLLDQNHTLTETFKRLRDVLDEKGVLDLDDFQLACDVFEESQTKGTTSSHFFKKMTH